MAYANGLVKKCFLIVFMVLCANVYCLADVEAEKDAQLASFAADVFLDKAFHTRTNWQTEDAERFGTELVQVLNFYRESLGEENYRILRGFLPKYAQEMAGTVVIVSLDRSIQLSAPSLYIDAFLADFEGRVQALAQRGGPIFADEFSRNVIRAQIHDVIDDSLQVLVNAGTISSDEKETTLNSLITYTYNHEAHPLRSSFKRMLSPEELENLNASLNVVLSSLDLSEDGIVNRINARRSAIDVKQRRIMGEMIPEMIRNWHIPPVLKSSETTDQLMNEAHDLLRASLENASENLR